MQFFLRSEIKQSLIFLIHQPVLHNEHTTDDPVRLLQLTTDILYRFF